MLEKWKKQKKVKNHIRCQGNVIGAEWVFSNSFCYINAMYKDAEVKATSSTSCFNMDVKVFCRTSPFNSVILSFSEWSWLDKINMLLVQLENYISPHVKEVCLSTAYVSWMHLMWAGICPACVTDRVEAMNELTKCVITLNTDPGWRTKQSGPMNGGSGGWKSELQRAQGWWKKAVEWWKQLICGEM